MLGETELCVDICSDVRKTGIGHKLTSNMLASKKSGWGLCYIQLPFINERGLN